ncbi:MAG TPA: hypothetical protein PKX20_06200, partial [Methanothrix soehngenii]|nr:hypothetical protein [Methanothrix soehngenii]
MVEDFEHLVTDLKKLHRSLGFQNLIECSTEVQAFLDVIHVGSLKGRILAIIAKDQNLSFIRGEG